MRAAPDAMLDDGLLEVVVCEHVSKLTFLTRILPKVFKGTHVHEPSVSVFRAHEMLLSAERPFTMYADGDPIGELPVRVRALQGAVTMLTPREPGPPSRGPDGRHARRKARAGTRRRRDLAPARRRRHERPGKLLMRLAPDAIGELGARLPRGSVLISATNGKTTTAAMTAGILERAGIATRPQPGGREHGRRGRDDAARCGQARRQDRRRTRSVRGGRAVARAAHRGAAPARDPARQPVPRPARPLRRARHDRRALGAGAAYRRACARAERR